MLEGFYGPAGMNVVFQSMAGPVQTLPHWRNENVSMAGVGLQGRVQTSFG